MEIRISVNGIEQMNKLNVKADALKNRSFLLTSFTNRFQKSLRLCKLYI